MKKFITWLFSTKRGSSCASFWARKWVEKLPLKELLGVNLAGLAFAMAIVVPQTSDAYSTWEATRDVAQVTIATAPAERETQWPLINFGISQYFRLGHPGLDLTAPLGNPVYPVANGTVAWTQSYAWGYGKHILVTHDNNVQSLYAHMSQVTVKAGDKVEKQTKIGEVGATGWATGNHVHLEVYQEGVPINPTEVLPDIKLEVKPPAPVVAQVAL